jgi:hypothetical protein
MLKMPPKPASISTTLRLADLRLPATEFAEIRWHAMQVIEMQQEYHSLSSSRKFATLRASSWSASIRARAPAPSRPPHRTARTADLMSIWSTGSFIDLHKAKQPPKTPAAGTIARSPAGAYATLGSDRRDHIAFC